MSSGQIFLNDVINDHGGITNPYTDFFMDSIGRGSGKYYSHIGEIFQASPHYQKGFGYLGYRQKHSFRHGRGIGSTLMSMFRMAIPLLKRGVQKLGTEAVDVAAKVASDAIQGENIKESAIKHASNTAQKILKDLPGTFSGIINKTAETQPAPVIPPTTLVAPRPTKKRKLLPSSARRKFGRGINSKKLQYKFPGLALL
jgi:hypothetical protein